MDIKLPNSTNKLTGLNDLTPPPKPKQIRPPTHPAFARDGLFESARSERSLRRELLISVDDPR